jgi:hypothetical protein
MDSGGGAVLILGGSEELKLKALPEKLNGHGTS